MPEGRARGTVNQPEVVKKTYKIIMDARKKGIEIELSEGFGFTGPLQDKVYDSNFFCGCGWNTFTIMHDGNIMGCPALDQPELGEGNIRDMDLKDIWWTRFEKFRETIFEDLPRQCKECTYMEICRGGCWLFRANKANPCFLKEAEEVARKIGV